MRESEIIIQEWKRAIKDEKKFALATVVSVNGSAYRRSGAKMLIREDGKWFGAISGGCLEGDALRKARMVINSKVSKLITYDTINEESAKSLGVGLGCEGIIEVLIEPDSDSLSTYFKQLQDALSADAELVVYLKLPTNSSSVERQYHFTFSDSWAQKAVSVKSSFFVESEDEKWFVEFIPKANKLYIFGAGYDAIPVAELAASIGWKVIVNDDCAAHLIPKRFACAENMVCGTPDLVIRDYPFDAQSAALLISHNFEFDKKALKSLLSTDVPYIGILGPNKRAQKLYDALAEESFEVTDLHKERIFAPVGLHIGAETPAEIAISIISEMMSFFKNATAKNLRERKAPIHQRQLV